MKPKYTKKQIQESIKYWQNVLENVNILQEKHNISEDAAIQLATDFAKTSDANTCLNEYMKKPLKEDFGVFAGAALCFDLFDLFGNNSSLKSYFKKNKVGAYDNNNVQLSKEDAVKRQQAWEEYLKQRNKRLADEKEVASKQPRLAMRLALPPEFETVPLKNFFFTTCEKIGELENVLTGPDYPNYPNTPFNIFTVYGPLSQLQKAFNKYGRTYFAYDSTGKKINPNATSLAECLVDANGNDLTFYKKGD